MDVETHSADHIEAMDPSRIAICGGFLNPHLPPLGSVQSVDSAEALTLFQIAPVPGLASALSGAPSQ
jgi:hypothetical protein